MRVSKEYILKQQKKYLLKYPEGSSKVCSHCGIKKDISEFYKYKCQCKNCHKAGTKDWSRTHKERKNELCREWRKNNPEKCKAYRKLANANMKINGTEDKVKRRKRLDRYRKKNPVKFKEYAKNSAIRNREKLLERSRFYTSKNKDKISARNKAQAEKLTDSYVIGMVKKRTYLTREIIKQYPLLIKLKRIQINHFRLNKN